VATGGNTVIQDYFYHSFRASDPPVVAPKETRLFAPSSAANDIIHSRTQQFRSVDGDASDMQLLGGADAIHIIIDLAISRDQRTAGADEGKHVAQVLGQAQALHDMATEFVARINAGATDAELKNWLSTLSKSSGPSSDRYESTKRRIVAEWSAALD